MKALLLALSLSLVSSVASAQAEGDPQGGPKGGGKPPHVARIQNDLEMTDEQVKKMRTIRDSGGTREEMNAVLTPEQQAKMAEMRKAHRADRAKRMKAALGLSDEQSAEIEKIRKAGGTREEVRAVLTPEQRVKFDEIRGKHIGKKGPPPEKKGPPAQE